MLIAIVRDTEGERISQLDDEPIEIGRHGTLRLADRRVSKHHARLQRDGADWFVEDMGSRNGTFINGMRVDRPLRVREGDKLELGSAQMIISRIIESKVQNQPCAPQPQLDAAPAELTDAPPPSELNAAPALDLDAAPPLDPPLDAAPPTEFEATPPDLNPPWQPESDQLPARVEVPQPAAAGADADEISLAAWLHALPVKRDVMQSMTPSMTPSMDPTLLSIRPLAQRDSSAQPMWRRALPYAALVLVLLAVGANLLLLVLFRGEARRDARELRDALAQQDQSSAEAVLRELREELRTPSAQQLQAWQALGDSLAEKHAALTEKLRADLASEREASAQLAAARQGDPAKPTADESRAALMRELGEIKEAIAALKQAAPAQASPQPDVAIAEPGTATAETAPRGESTGSPAVAPPAAIPVVAPAPAPAVAEQKPLAQMFLIDASAALQHSIPEAVAEVRRVMADTRQRGSSRILLLYQGRLIELPVAALESRDVEPLDRGAADLAAALKAALVDRPPVLYVFSDTLGDVNAAMAIIRQADTRGTSIHVTQFYSREHRDQLKALARDFHGNYSFIPPR